MGLKSKTVWEDRLYGDCLSVGLPMPQRNFRFVAGRKFCWDLAWPEFRIAVEIQGGVWASRRLGHATGAGINRDCEKSNLAQLAGWISLAVTSDQIKSGQALRWIELAFMKRKSLDNYEVASR